MPTDPDKPLSEEEKHIRQLAQISPMQLLAFYQKGGRIPASDVEIVESLIRHYGLPPGVVNVLLEYVLLKYDYKLPRNLVEKIAGHWKRLGISTVEEAVEQAAWVYDKLENAGIRVIRTGLQPDAELVRPGNVLAGPFHPAMGELVKSRLYRQKAARLPKAARGCPSRSRRNAVRSSRSSKTRSGAARTISISWRSGTPSWRALWPFPRTP